MNCTKEKLFESALALNGDDKKYVITVEGDKIITRIKWMDATFFSPTAITDKVKDFEFIVEVGSNGTYTEIDKHEVSSKSAGLGGLKYNKSVFVGNTKTYSRTIGFGTDKQNNDTGIIDIEFNSEEYKKPIRTLLENSGYKKKTRPVGKYIIGASILLAIGIIALIILLLSQNSERKAIGADEFEAIAKSSGYLIQIDENFEDDYEKVYIAEDEKDDYKILLYYLSDSEHAKDFYESEKSDIEKFVSESTGNASKSSISVLVYENYSASTNENYLYIARIENTVLIVKAGIEHKEEVQKFINELGY